MDAKSTNITNWISHMEWLVIFLTLLGGFHSLNSRIDATNARMDGVNTRFDQLMYTWHSESRDFHGRLLEQNLEFGMRIKGLEPNTTQQ